MEKKKFSITLRKYSIYKKDIKINSVEKKPFEIDFGIDFPIYGELYEGCLDRVWVTVYGEVKHELAKCT